MNDFRKLLAVEAKLFWRDPVTWLAAIVLPTVVLLILGWVFAPHRPDPLLGGQRFIDLFVPSLLVITLATLGIQTLPIKLATYREKGILRRMSTTPVHPSRILVAQLVIYMVTAVLALVLLVIVGNLFFQIPVPVNLVGYAVAFLLGMSSLFALGLLVAAVAPSARVATGLALPMFFVAMFLGGVYLPRWLLPEVISEIGVYAPPGVQGLTEAWLGATPQLLPLLVMAGLTIGIGAIAVRLFRWE